MCDASNIAFTDLEIEDEDGYNNPRHHYGSMIHNNIEINYNFDSVDTKALK